MNVRLEDLKPGARVTGLTPDEAVEIIAATWVGSDTLTVIFRTSSGGIAERTLFRDDEPRLALSEAELSAANCCSGSGTDRRYERVLLPCAFSSDHRDNAASVSKGPAPDRGPASFV